MEKIRFYLNGVAISSAEIPEGVCEAYDALRDLEDTEDVLKELEWEANFQRFEEVDWKRISRLQSRLNTAQRRVDRLKAAGRI